VTTSGSLDPSLGPRRTTTRQLFGTQRRLYDHSNGAADLDAALLGPAQLAPSSGREHHRQLEGGSDAKLLLNRSTRRLALTPAGERYLQHCLPILANLDKAEEEARGAHERPAGFSFTSAWMRSARIYATGTP
jgi:hypothetical protein